MIVNYQNYVVRFMLPYSNKMRYIECDTATEAMKLRDWFRSAGAESAIGYIKNNFILSDSLK